MTDALDIVLVLPVLERAGAERIVAELARRLPAHGIRTSVICLEDERAPVGKELAAEGISVRGLRVWRRRTFTCASALARTLPAARPLIVHSHLFHANIAARMAGARLTGVRVLSTVHVVERRFRPWQFKLDRWTAKDARAEVCVSRAVAEFQQARTGLPSEFFRVIPNGIDLARFVPGPEGSRAPATVVSVGRLDPQKDYPTLLRAWRDVEAQMPAARLEIAGEGAIEAGLRSLSARLELKNVKFLGFVSDVSALLRRATLYVQSSAWEGFGLAVAEAMATGLPAVVTGVDSLPEIVTHGVTGLVVPKGEPGPLAAALLELLRDPARAGRMGTAAREDALGRFSVDRMVADYARLYREIT